MKLQFDGINGWLWNWGTVSLQGCASKCQCSEQKKQSPVPSPISCLWEATSVLHVLQGNRGLVPEINPDLLPGLIAGVKDFHQIALWFCKQAFPGWWLFFFLIPIFSFLVDLPFHFNFLWRKILNIYNSRKNDNEHPAAININILSILFHLYTSMRV